MIPPMATDADAETFLQRWQAAGGSERANYQLFVTELCTLLDLPLPEPSRDDQRDNPYVFERRVSFAHGDGHSSVGFIDCYKRGAFVLEAKKLRSDKAGAHTRASTTHCCAPARRPKAMRARCPPPRAGRPSCWWWTRTSCSMC